MNSSVKGIEWPNGDRSFRKGRTASASTSIWQKGASTPALALMPDNEVPPVGPWLLSDCCTSAGAQREGVPLSPCAGPLRGVPGTAAALFLLSHNPHRFSQPEVIRTSSPGSGTLGQEAWCGAGTPRSSGGTSTAEISLPIFTRHTWVKDQPHSMSLSLLPVSMWLFSFLY